jgi:hypothetical protein
VQQHRHRHTDEQAGDEAEHLERDHPVDVPLRWVPSKLEAVPDAGKLVLAGQPPSEAAESGHSGIEDALGEGLVQLLLEWRRSRVQGIDGGQRATHLPTLGRGRSHRHDGQRQCDENGDKADDQQRCGAHVRPPP